MTRTGHPAVTLRPYGSEDLGLLQALLGDPEMTRFLGGPDSEAVIAARHERYLSADPETNALFTILLGPASTPVGWVGFWESEWEGEVAWECGWHVLVAFQRRGVATAAVRLALEVARSRGRHRWADAFPSADNVASNALCRTLGFTSLERAEVEYPKGSMMSAQHWRFDLDGAA